MQSSFHCLPRTVHKCSLNSRVDPWSQWTSALFLAKLTSIFEWRFSRKEEFKLVLNICFPNIKRQFSLNSLNLFHVSVFCKTFANKHQLCIKCQPYPRLCNCHQPNYTKPLARFQTYTRASSFLFFFHEKAIISEVVQNFLDVKNYATSARKQTRREEGEMQWGEVGNFWWSLTSHIILYIFVPLSPIQSISNILKLFKQLEILHNRRIPSALFQFCFPCRSKTS